jgi:hypothetical protein
MEMDNVCTNLTVPTIKGMAIINLFDKSADDVAPNLSKN